MNLPPSQNDGKPGGLAGKVGKALLYTSLGGAVHWICEHAGHKLSAPEVTGIVSAIAAAGEKFFVAGGDLSTHVIGERLGHTLFHADAQHPTSSGLNHDIEHVLARAAARTIVGLMSAWEELPQERRGFNHGEFEFDELRDACRRLLENLSDATVPERIAGWLAALDDDKDILKQSGFLARQTLAAMPPEPCTFAEYFDWRFPAAFEQNFAEELTRDEKARDKFTLLL